MTNSNDNNAKVYVVLPKLIYQLANGRVILERLPEIAVQNLLSGSHNDPDPQNDIHAETGEESREKSEVPDPNFPVDESGMELGDQLPESSADGPQNETVHLKDDATWLSHSLGHCLTCNYSAKNVTYETRKCPTCQNVYDKYECGSCNRHYLNFHTLRRHLLYKCKYKASTCAACGKHFELKIHLKYHLRFCNKEPTSACHLCTFKTFFKNRLEAHMVKKHKNHYKENQDYVPNDKHPVRTEAALVENRNPNVESNHNEKPSYREISENTDVNRRNYMKSLCCKCNLKTAAGAQSNSKCPKCKRICRKFQCDKCQKIFSYFYSLKLHIYNKCIPSATYLCEKCDFRSHVKNQILLHLKLHADLSKCTKTLMTKDYTDENENIEESTEKEGIPQRDQESIDLADAETNSDEKNESEANVTESENGQTTSDVKVADYQITRIKDDGTRKNHFIAHCHKCKETATVDGVTDSTCRKCNEKYQRFQCGKCQVQYPHFISLLTHLYYTCMPLVTYSCRTCDYQTHLKNMIVKHGYWHKNKSSCLKCQQKFPNEASARNHLKHCGKDYKFHCNLCDYKCFKEKFLVVHIKVKHSIKHTITKKDLDGKRARRNNKLVCPKCNKQFKFSRGLGSHVKYCKRERTVACELCKFKTFNSATLITHMNYKH